MAVMARVRACTVAGCGRDHYGLGLCMMHYRRVKRYGTIHWTSNRQWRLTNKGRGAVGLPQRYVEVPID